MTHEVVTRFSDLFADFFGLSPVTASGAGQDEGIPAYAPTTANALTAAYFLSRTLTDLVECANDVGSLDLPNESTTVLQGLMARMRVKFESILCSYWVRGP